MSFESKTVAQVYYLQVLGRTDEVSIYKSHKWRSRFHKKQAPKCHVSWGGEGVTVKRVGMLQLVNKEKKDFATLLR